MNTSQADAPLDAPSPEDETLEADTPPVAPPRQTAARPIWPGSPTPALTYPDPPARSKRPATGA